MVVGAQGHVVSTQPGSRRGFVTGDVAKHRLFFFFFPSRFKNKQATTKKRNFLTCGQLRKEKLLLRENCGRCQRGEAPAARADPSAVSPLPVGTPWALGTWALVSCCC